MANPSLGVVSGLGTQLLSETDIDNPLRNGNKKKHTQSQLKAHITPPPFDPCPGGKVLGQVERYHDLVS